MAERLYRSRDDRMLAGVAGGVAETLDADPSIVRVVWAVLAILTGGIAILVYIVMAIVVPEAPAGWSSRPGGTTPAAPNTLDPSGASDAAGVDDTTKSWVPQAAKPAAGSYWAPDREARREARRASRGGSVDTSRAGLIGGLVLIVIGAIFLIREVVPWFDWALWWPIGLILLGGVLLVLALLPGRSAE